MSRESSKIEMLRSYQRPCESPAGGKEHRSQRAQHTLLNISFVGNVKIILSFNIQRKLCEPLIQELGDVQPAPQDSVVFPWSLLLPYLPLAQTSCLF